MLRVVHDVPLFLFIIHQPSAAVIRFAHVSSLRLVDATHLSSAGESEAH